MTFNGLAMTAAWLATSFIAGAEALPCLAGTVLLEVTTAADVETLMSEINCTGHGDFNITWNENILVEHTINVSNGKNVTITGAGFPTLRYALEDDHNSSAMAAARSVTGIFSVSQGSVLSLHQLTLTGGNAEIGGAIAVMASSSLLLYGCTFKNNQASYGGAIYAIDSEIYIDGFTAFFNNSADNNGGAIHVKTTDIQVDGESYYENNAANSSGGAIYAIDSNIHVDGSNVFGSNSAFRGGAIYANHTDIRLDGGTLFANNSANDGGGAIFAFGIDMQTHGDTSFENNLAYGDGGAMLVESSVVNMNGSTIFTYNAAYDGGGGMFVRSSDLDIYGYTMFAYNSANDNGGAVYLDKSNAFLPSNTNFSSNFAKSQGGALFSFLSKVYIDGNAEFGNNSAGYSGGAIWAVYFTLHFKGDVNFTRNSAGDTAGAIYVEEARITIGGGAIFADNSVGRNGGSAHVYVSDLVIEGLAIFTNNSAGGNGGAVCVVLAGVHIHGGAIFANNNAVADGGAVYGMYMRFNITGRNIDVNGLSGSEGTFYPGAGGDYTSNWSVAFIDNSAGNLGGAICTEASRLYVTDGAFKSNRASLGGAVYVGPNYRLTDPRSIFAECLFEDNRAADGGAAYLSTAGGTVTVIASDFRNNSAVTSGGAIYHTGSLDIFHSSFVANEVGVEGPAIISIGGLEALSNVRFSENTFYCRAGEYGYIAQNEAGFCRSCFNEVCSRCDGGRDGTNDSIEVRIDGLPVCVKPPLGAVALSRGTTVDNLTLLRGYFRTSNESHDVRKCYHERACRGGSDTDEYCTFGYTGPYCAVCEDGFAPGISYSCRECSGGRTRWAVGLTGAFGLVLIMLAALVIYSLGNVVRDGAGEDAERDERWWKQRCWYCRVSLATMLPFTAIKIVVTVWQIISQFDSIAGDVFPELYANFISKLNPINLDFDFVFSYSCLVTNDFYHRLLFATVSPLLALVVLGGSYIVGTKRNSFSESAMREVRYKHQAAVLYVAFFVYSPVSYRIFQTFGCDQLDNGETYLRADYRLSCLTSRHSWFEAYALTMVAVYPVGIAAAFTYLLLWYRRDLTKSDRETMRHLKPVQGIWAAYKPTRYYFEIIECGRRIGFSAVAAFVPSNSTANVSIALLCALVCVFISEVVSPFQKKVDMGLYRWGNGVVVASMYVAFLMKIDVGYDTENALLTFSGVLIAANVFMAVAVLIQTTLLIKEFRSGADTTERAGASVRRTERHLRDQLDR